MLVLVSDRDAHGLDALLAQDGGVAADAGREARAHEDAVFSRLDGLDGSQDRKRARLGVAAEQFGEVLGDISRIGDPS